MKYSLSVEERDSVLAQLSESQRDFINQDMIRSRRTVFAQTMAKAKGASIPDSASLEDVEQFLDGWIYTGYVDAGHVSSDYPCECGRPLRYQHKVQHKQSGQIMHFGIVHLGEHLSLDPKTVALIVKGFNVLDSELDEILTKLREGWDFDEALSMRVPEGYTYPPDILEHMQLHLPLLDRQVLRLRKSISRFLADTLTRATTPKRPHLLPNIEPEMVPVITVNNDQYTILFPDELRPEARSTRSAPESIESNIKQNFKGNEIVLEEQLRSKVKELIKAETRSARVITEILLREGATDQRRYSTGKPHLYTRVCIYIDSELIPDGVCNLVEASADDRLYSTVGNNLHS